MFSKRIARFAGILLLAVSGPLARPGCSQNVHSHATHEVDLAFTYSPVRQSGVSGTSFWQQGGAMELSAEAFRGFGIAMALSGGQARNANHSGVNINTVTVLFGPRYETEHGRLAFFGEGLVGVSNAFDGVYPSARGATNSTDSFASRAGGGVDLRLSRHVALRPVEAYWLRTQFPNAGSNVQNALQLGGGIVLRWP